MLSLMDRIDDHRGFWPNPDWQGRGLMSEASEAATDFRLVVSAGRRPGACPNARACT